MPTPPPPEDASSASPSSSSALAGRTRGIVLVAGVIAVGAFTGTLPFVVPLVLLWVVIRWARVAGGVTVSRILLASEVQMAPALEGRGLTVAEDGQGPRAPDEATAAVLPGGERRVRRRFVPRADLRPLEVATIEVVGGIGGLRRRAVVVVAYELADPDDAAGASALLEASTLVPAGEVPETARFGCAGGWVIAAFDPLRTRDPGAAAGALQAALGRIVTDASKR